MSQRRSDAIRFDDAQRRELYFFSLYRVLEAALLALMLFSPAGALIGEPRHALLGKLTTVTYLVVSVMLLYWAHSRRALRGQVMVGTAIDIAVATLATHALPIAAPGIALMLVFNIGAAALLLPLRYGLGGAAIAAAAMFGEFVWSALRDGESTRPLAELLMFGVSYLAIAMLTYLLSRQMRASQALAERRGAEVEDLAKINELIIRRMRTGVLLVDGDGRLRLANEAALLLLGEVGDGERSLALAAPELARRLHDWQRSGIADDAPLRLGSDQLEVLPRFARLYASDDTTLVFLDDASLLSRRAESMTLATLGRFSASLAHEIRNPLAAISYATQLLEESTEIAAGDRRLLQIIYQQCLRTNGIVESVLGLARRERANPEHVDLVQFSRRFVEDYQSMLPPESGTLQASGGAAPVPALVDPRHLQQVLTVLVSNALTYGRLPGSPARVMLRVQPSANAPQIDVVDRGPGIPDAVVSQLFRPFYTTSEHGTGLGLYIARELCRSNGANLEYVNVPGGGSCFRLTLPGPHALLPA
ncbi:MAG TPA: HAMP domain-containing sensor histidine kinase [Luteimonas sp.]|nr:HAMP domain-containing sensor histidine kinase [Luteimonas sp.]